MNDSLIDELEGDAYLIEVDGLAERAPEHIASQMRKAAAALRAQEWISVDERLPPHAREVLAAGPGVEGVTMLYCQDGRWYDGPADEWVNITHWMPLPSPPIESET